MPETIGHPRDVPVEASGGIRGLIGVIVKRTIRKSIRWYVFGVVREVREAQAISNDRLQNAERTLSFLRQELEVAHREISRLHLHVRQLSEKTQDLHQ